MTGSTRARRPGTCGTCWRGPGPTTRHGHSRPRRTRCSSGTSRWPGRWRTAQEPAGRASGRAPSRPPKSVWPKRCWAGIDRTVTVSRCPPAPRSPRDYTVCLRWTPATNSHRPPDGRGMSRHPALRRPGDVTRDGESVERRESDRSGDFPTLCGTAIRAGPRVHSTEMRG